MAIRSMIILFAATSIGCGDDDNAHTPLARPSPTTPAPPLPGPGPLPTFIQPTKVCRDPVQGAAPGRQEGGKVCTWQAISGATEPGRNFADYADCDVVRTQRPYIPMPPNDTQPTQDPRLEDRAYVKELDWVRSEIAATGCACCHSMAAPLGPVRWTIDAPGNWVNTFADRDLAASAEWIDTSLFGRFEPQENNGFERRYGYPSTDPRRLQLFFEQELAHRGLDRRDFDQAPPTGGPLVEQTTFVPTSCTQGEGVGSDGLLQWSGGPARYVYVLTKGSKNPMIPPNLDTPSGTLWRADVPSDRDPVMPGSFRYGEVFGPLKQRHPAQGLPLALESGQTYYLYVTRDVFQPITRCLFVAP